MRPSRQSLCNRDRPQERVADWLVAGLGRVFPLWRAAVAVPMSIAYGAAAVALVFIYLRPVRQFIYFQF
jgi:hypothetical protein